MTLHTVNSETESVTRSLIPPNGGYVTFAWPRDMSSRECGFIRELLELSIGGIERRAKLREAGEAEYLSWFPPWDSEYRSPLIIKP